MTQKNAAPQATDQPGSGERRKEADPQTPAPAVAAPCAHPWLGDGPQPAKFDCRCGTRVYRSYDDYCWD
jgi:hypothetical protein